MDEGVIAVLAARLGAQLAQRGAMCATAESCTGGLVAGAITDVAGSSGWFDRGFVTYSNQAKTEMLGVAEATLAHHGAVSEESARAMAQGALERSAARYAVAVTGVAGPGGGTAEKPVGMVCFAWAERDSGTRVATHRFDGDRAAVRRACVVVALEGLLAAIASGQASA